MEKAILVNNNIEKIKYGTTKLKINIRAHLSDTSIYQEVEGDPTVALTDEVNPPSMVRDSFPQIGNCSSHIHLGLFLLW